MTASGCFITGTVGFPANDGSFAEDFDGFVEWLTGLLAQNLAKQHAKGTYIAA
jgi:hypothetical protein